MPGKSAYEIRASLLQLAFQILLEQANAAAPGPGGTRHGPTTEEVIVEAEKLNGFVSTKAS